MNESVIIKSEEVLLFKVLKEIEESEPGTKERESAVATYKTLMEKISDVDRLETDLYYKKCELAISPKEVVDWILRGAGIGVGVLTIASQVHMGNKTLELEETGTIKTNSGRKWLINQKWPKV